MRPIVIKRPVFDKKAKKGWIPSENGVMMRTCSKPDMSFQVLDSISYWLFNATRQRGASRIL